MQYNPGTAFVFSIAEIYHDAVNSGAPELSKTDANKIIKMFESSIVEGHFYDFYAAKTYLVVELLTNILHEKLRMADSLFRIIDDVHQKFSNKNPEPDIGIMRIEEFKIIETDRPSILTLKTESATEILFGLIMIGYRFNDDFLDHCSKELRVFHKL